MRMRPITITTVATPEAFAIYVEHRAAGHTPTAAAKRAGIDRRTAFRLERRENGHGLFWLRSRQQGAALAREARLEVS